jgi:hypothetical protein
VPGATRLTLTAISTSYSQLPTPTDVLHEVVVESLARQALIRQLYFNTCCGPTFGHQSGQTLHVHSFAGGDTQWTAPVTTKFPPKWHGWWRVLNDRKHLGQSYPEQPLRAELVLTAGWDHTGTFVIRARIKGSEIPVHLL